MESRPRKGKLEEGHETWKRAMGAFTGHWGPGDRSK